MKNSILKQLSLYQTLKIKINQKTTTLQVLKSTLGSLLLSFIICLIPILLVYNLFVFDSLITVLKIVIYLLIIAFSFLYNSIYVLLIKNYVNELAAINFKAIVIVESVVASVFLSMFATVIISIF